jgi:hypothetical protein
MKKLILMAAVLTLLSVAVLNLQAQKKARLGKVCGNPNVACKGSENFQASDLPFDTGKNYIIAESVPFYAIVLKSAKYKYPDCQKAFPESERLETQQLFPDNKVFAVRCSEPGESYYTGMNAETMFMGVYAGSTRAQADAFLKKVQATKKFPGVRVRKTQTGLNGT